MMPQQLLLNRQFITSETVQLQTATIALYNMAVCLAVFDRKMVTKASSFLLVPPSSEFTQGS